MLVAPTLDPIAIDLGPIKIHWYGLMYVFAFAAVWWFSLKRAKQPNSGWTTNQVSDLVFYGALGVILGGRIGYVVFYNAALYLEHPLDALKVWQGGMSFHGGLAGVVLALWLFARRFHKPLLAVTDFVAPWVPIGLAAGRLGNFINHELWGRVTDVPWGMVFPEAGPLPRHPSQLYEFTLEGVALFLILWLYSRRPRAVGSVSALFLVCYGSFRFFVEFVREPDAQLGFILDGVITMGQVLSLPMILLGLSLFFYLQRRMRAEGLKE